jgi:hypothetical protein
MGNLIQLKDTSNEVSECIHAPKHESMGNFECPGCRYVSTRLRSNCVQNGDSYVIDFKWLEYNSSGKYVTFDGRNEGGKWDVYRGKALLNINYQLVKKFDGKLSK